MMNVDGSGRSIDDASAGRDAPIDHLVYAAPDLEEGIARLERLLGVRASPGGQHLAWGTRNALIALGDEVYLEIIGPDPEPTSAPDRGAEGSRQSEPQTPSTAAAGVLPGSAPRNVAGASPRMPYGLDRLTEPRLVTWVARSADLEGVVARARAHGVDLGAVLAGSRRRPDGSLLAWRLTDIFAPRADGIVPFFIDWGASPHPAMTAAKGCALVSLRAEHPDADAVLAMLAALELELNVDTGPTPALIATIRGRHGLAEIR